MKHFNSINIDNIQLHIIYSMRKFIELKPNTILVRALKGMTRRGINVFINEKRPWIEKYLAKMQERKVVLEQMQPFTMDEIRELANKALIVITDPWNRSGNSRFKCRTGNNRAETKVK